MKPARASLAHEQAAMKAAGPALRMQTTHLTLRKTKMPRGLHRAAS
jgi:hypothetical protein